MYLGMYIGMYIHALYVYREQKLWNVEGIAKRPVTARV